MEGSDHPEEQGKLVASSVKSKEARRQAGGDRESFVYSAAGCFRVGQRSLGRVCFCNWIGAFKNFISKPNLDD